MFNIPARCWHSVITYFDQQILLHSQIAKPAGTDFKQSMLPTFDNRKATNFTQFVISNDVAKLFRQRSVLLDILCQHIGVKNQAEPANGIWWQIICCHIISTDTARFLLSIYWHSMSAGFVEKSWAKCGHRWLRFYSENLIDFANLLAIFTIWDSCVTDADTYAIGNLLHVCYQSAIYVFNIICLLLIATLSYILSIKIVTYVLEVC